MPAPARTQPPYLAVSCACTQARRDPAFFFIIALPQRLLQSAWHHGGGGGGALRARADFEDIVTAHVASRVVAVRSGVDDDDDETTRRRVELSRNAHATISGGCIAALCFGVMCAQEQLAKKTSMLPSAASGLRGVISDEKRTARTRLRNV